MSDLKLWEVKLDTISDAEELQDEVEEMISVFEGCQNDSEIRLMIGTKESCLEATRQALSEAKKQLTGHTIKLVLLFDSISRYMLLGRDASLELELSREVFGKDTPILGIYTYGEQAPLTAINYRGKSYFHNQTINVLTIGG